MGLALLVVLAGALCVFLYVSLVDSGEQSGTSAEVPEDVSLRTWRNVSPSQAEAASRLGIPAAFENSLGMRFVLIPPGTFDMGSPENEVGRDDDESLISDVVIKHPFYLQITEVTNAQWRAFDAHHVGTFSGPNQPVDSVSYRNVVGTGSDRKRGFLRWLNDRLMSPEEPVGIVYTLPTEVRWEYACRAGTTTPFHFGETISTEQVNFAGDAIFGTVAAHGYRERTLDVGSFLPNAWGLYDMHGNVYEWCQLSLSYDSQSVPGYAVMRGGSWCSYLQHVRTANRRKFLSHVRTDCCGFRVCAEIR